MTDNNRKNGSLSALVSLLNLGLLLVVLMSMNGINVLSAFVHDSQSREAITVIPDSVVDGKIIEAYSVPEEASVVTVVEVKSAMSQIGEITTIAYEYSGEAYERDCNTLFGWEVGFTENSIDVSYKGTIRAGYVIKDIKVDIDQETKTIYITLPEAKVFSNEITAQDIEWKNNVFNHIDPDVASDLLDEAKEEEQEEALSNGLFDEADSNARTVITDVLSVFDGYKVEFISSKA